MAKVELTHTEVKCLVDDLFDKHNKTYDKYRIEIESMLKSKFLYRVVFKMKSLNDWHDYITGNILKMDECLRLFYFENDFEFIEKLSDIVNMGNGCTLDDNDLSKIKSIETKYIDSCKETG